MHPLKERCVSEANEHRFSWSKALENYLMLLVAFSFWAVLLD